MSDIATKLITVADNSLAVADIVNATKVTASGTAVRVDDVLNVEYPLGVQLKSDTLTDFSGVNVSRYGKNLIDISIAEPYSSKTTIGLGEDWTLIHNGKTTGSPLSKKGTNVRATLQELVPGIKVGETYTINATTTATRKYIYLQGNYNKSWYFGKSLRITEAMLTDAVLFYSDGDGVEVVISNIQFELGTVATEFEPYQEPQTATSDSNGKVAGLTSTPHSMTIVPDSDAVTVECTYFPESAVGIYEKYQQLRTEQTSLQTKLQEYKEA